MFPEPSIASREMGVYRALIILCICGRAPEGNGKLLSFFFQSIFYSKQKIQVQNITYIQLEERKIYNLAQ